MISSLKIGVVSCSGEGCVEGTISRIATRLVLERLPENTVTICLPLFLTGEKGERMFAKFFPTISVDGCEKECAKRAIEKYSDKVTHSIVVTELFEKKDIENCGTRRVLNKKGLESASMIVDKIENIIDALLIKR